MDAIGEQVGRLLNRRIAYFIGVIMFLNGLDRVNVSFAAKTMNAELDFDPQTYGFGVGLFFVTYMLFQIPGVAVANRVGPGRMLAATTVLWGLVTVGTSFIWNTHSFYIARLMLGVVEGSVAPVIILYASRWIPSAAFGRFSSRSALSLPASVLLGAPLSGWLIVRLDGLSGVSGWRWMFVAEGLVTVIVGLASFRLLPEAPQDARWLSEEQRDWLVAELGVNKPADDGGVFGQPPSWRERYRVDGLIGAWSMVFFSLCMGFYGFMYWLPQVIQSIAPAVGTGAMLALSALPWAFTVVGMFVNGAWSDRTGRRPSHVSGAALICAVGLLVTGLATNAGIAFAGLVLCGLGIGGAQSLFFSIPAEALRNRPHAGFAFACITLAGGLSGLVGANLIGLMRQATGTFTSSIFMLATFYLLAAVVLMLSSRARARDTTTV